MFNLKKIIFGEMGETEPMNFKARNKGQQRDERKVIVTMHLTLDLDTNSNVLQVLRDSDIEVILPDGANIIRADLAKVEIRQ